VPVLSTGVVDLRALEEVLTPDTAVVSVMWANNETGVINPVEAVTGLCAARKILVHCDAVQAAGKLPIGLAGLAIDYLTVSAHKLFGPKGVGALIVGPDAPYTPMVVGGHQEEDRRGGTENVPAIVGFGRAAELVQADLGYRSARSGELRDTLEGLVLREIPGTYCNGHGAARIPNTTNIGFSGIDSEGLVKLLDKEGVCVSAGSACLANTLTPSHVVQAMTGSYAKAGEAIRFSLSHLNTQEDIQTAVGFLKANVSAIRRRQPQRDPPG
jgi:cysteine desulfurase